jgi:predicted kinase
MSNVRRHKHNSVFRMPVTPTLHFICGKAGAGKTTVANGLAQEHAAFFISEDIWMMRLFGDQMKSFDDYLHFSPKLKSVVGPLATQLLKSGTGFPGEHEGGS